MYAERGYAIDWDWSAELTLWRTGPDRADRVVTTHRLDRRPKDEHHAAVAARQWWRREASKAVGTHEQELASEESR